MYLGPPVPFLTPWLEEGCPTKIDNRKKGTLILPSLLKDLAVGDEKGSKRPCHSLSLKQGKQGRNLHAGLRAVLFGGNLANEN